MRDVNRILEDGLQKEVTDSAGERKLKSKNAEGKATKPKPVSQLGKPPRGP